MDDTSDTANPNNETPNSGSAHKGPTVSITDELRTSYLDYAMSVIVSRAIPDLRDGLKPVHRRILYAMHETGNTHDKAYRKSARPVGEVMGKYHPHGDGAIYDALVRMAQDFSMSLPLLDGQGNFGSMDGDNPAAMRYTEVRMDHPAAYVLADIDKDTVDFKDAIEMFKWFFGVGPRPYFDRWTYWEKFDYWAPFWGMTIIGVSGMMMWLPDLTASYLPGWVFNVAAIVHGEEAFLAAVFLFTVHFFNNHFRPDNFPQSTTMFTGRMSLDEYRHEHRRDYERLWASGGLGKYLVNAPTPPQSRAASLLGATLITIGLILLTLVITGFLGL